MDNVSEYFNGKRVVITGAAGYLAASIASLLQDADCHVMRLDLPGTSRKPVIGTAKMTDIFGDVRDPSIWSQCIDADIVFHLAAQTSSQFADADPIADHAVNVTPMQHLLEACRTAGTSPTICFSSTVTICGIPGRLPVDEAISDHPITMYDLHKRMAEDYLHWYSEQGYVKGVSLRLANIYGPGPASSSPDRGILNRMIRAALAGEGLTVYGSGDYLRDYLYVEDAARAFLAAATMGTHLAGQHYVIGSGVGHTIHEAATMVATRAAARTGRTVGVTPCTPPSPLAPIELRNFVADYRRFRDATGWLPLVSLEEGIDRTLETLS